MINQKQIPGKLPIFYVYFRTLEWNSRYTFGDDTLQTTYLLIFQREDGVTHGMTFTLVIKWKAPLSKNHLYRFLSGQLSKFTWHLSLFSINC